MQRSLGSVRRVSGSRWGRLMSTLSKDDDLSKKGKAKKMLFQNALADAPQKPTGFTDNDEIEQLRKKEAAAPVFFTDEELDSEYGKFKSIMDSDDDDNEESDYVPVRGRVENEMIMADKTWPLTSGSDLWMDLIQIPKDGKLEDNERELVLKAAFERMGHTSVWDVQLPTMSVDVPEDDPDYKAFAVMKQALMNNGRIKMADKNEIMTMLVDEVTRLRADKTDLIPGLNLDED
ncbi:hypothetical protein DYB37_011033 [Aphanomyces astaci]|nr:hypothetical protein DYB25_003038 [Aphanomyces astaci]RHY49668.1 hypothetical protein DYB34_009307 [Aphanomyces astaci]RHY86186.1 hypothetical protein DYB35_009813 [Aphanomyces astaci]RHZ10820.1 hypothetical protein DYB37_011033 [Aphanomyces astaci]RLO09246.1 hypothetical protein DYB28_008394 [Aphanomyces astaci]